MLTENDIIKYLTNHLKSNGYVIIQSLTTNEKGVDIIAERNKTKLYIEAKGETSSKSHTNRYGKPFTKNQVKSHVSRAILTSMEVISAIKNGEKTEVALALPDTESHRELINRIMPAITILDLKIFWVSKKGVLIN